ncbi:MAG: DUF92 domain-containing protein [Thermoanaerobaculia bacterium]
MSVPHVEWARKAVHGGSGFFAFSLRFLSWKAAAVAALAAVLFNTFALPRLGGRSLLRESEAGRTHSAGILAYPVVVLVMILLFRDRLEIAAAGWALLAFGDAAAGLVGMSFGGPRLFWNREKTLSGLLAYVLFGSLSAALLFGFVRRGPASPAELFAIVLAALAGAAVESLPSELNDNLLPPLVGAGVLAVLLDTLPGWTLLGSPGFLRILAFSAALNLAIALLAGWLRVVRPSGVAAGFAFGTVVLAFGGAAAYALLWLFFATGTIATRFRRLRKEAMGKAEEAGGRRGAANVLANVTVPAFFVVAAFLAPAEGTTYQLAAAAAFATALMDTIGTEVGQAIHSATVLLPDFRRVAPGTDGAVSIAGTLAGLAGALALGVAAAMAGWIPWAGVAVVVLAATAGTIVESLLGRDRAPWRVSSGHVLNFVNTFVGAGTALLVSGAGGVR